MAFAFRPRRSKPRRPSSISIDSGQPTSASSLPENVTAPSSRSRSRPASSKGAAKSRSIRALPVAPRRPAIVPKSALSGLSFSSRSGSASGPRSCP